MENLEPKTRFEYFLNKIAENKGSSSNDSSGGGILVVGVVETTDGDDHILTLTKTYHEIKNATFAIIVKEEVDGDSFSRFICTVTYLSEGSGSYIVTDSVDDVYETDSIDGYPSNRHGR